MYRRWVYILPLGFILWHFKKYVGGCNRYVEGVGNFKEEWITPKFILGYQQTDEWEDD